MIKRDGTTNLLFYNGYHIGTRWCSMLNGGPGYKASVRYEYGAAEVLDDQGQVIQTKVLPKIGEARKACRELIDKIKTGEIKVTA